MVQERPGPQLSEVVGGVERFKTACEIITAPPMTNLRTLSILEKQIQNLYIPISLVIFLRSHWKFASTSVIGGALERN